MAALPIASALATSPPATRALLLDAALNGHAIFAVGERGTMIRSVDSGETWETLATPIHSTLTAIAFVNTTHGWAVGHDGVILNTRDGGESWEEQFHAPDPETIFLDVAALDPNRAIAIGAFGVCYTTRDGGRTWLKHELIEEDNHLNRVAPGAEGELFIAGERGTLLHLKSFNKPAEILPPPRDVSFYGILVIEPRALLACGLRGHLYRSEDDGLSWTALPTPHPALLATAIQMKSGTIVIAGQSRTFLTSRDGGQSFQSWHPPLATAVAELLEAPNGMLLAFGEAGVTRLEPPPPALPREDGTTEASP